MLNEQSLQSFTKKQLIVLVLQLYKKITDLEVQVQSLKKDSSNSSKPPSSDNQPKRNRLLRQKSGKSTGGQNGLQGATRTQVENPDTTISCRSKQCEACDTDLTKLPGQAVGKRQEIDIPPIIPTTTEYQQEEIVCPCGHINCGIFPEQITAPVQFGLNLQSFIVYLHVAHKIPYQRLTQILGDILGIKISEGTINNVLTQIHNKGTPLINEILNQLKQAKWVGSDETGTKVKGQKWWQWVWQNVNSTLYAIKARDIVWSDRSDPVLREQIIESYHKQLQVLMVRDCTGTESRKLQKRLRKHHDKVLTFLSDPDIPFHNNSSEQAIQERQDSQEDIRWLQE